MVEFPAKNSAILTGKGLDRASKGILLSLRLCFRARLGLETVELIMGRIGKRDLRKKGNWVFKITGGFSSFVAYITEEASFEEEDEEAVKKEDHFLIGSLAVITGEKLAGTDGDLAGKGR